jgi:hypothetical protein
VRHASEYHPPWHHIAWLAWCGILFLGAVLSLFPGWPAVGSAFAKWSLKDWFDLVAAVATCAAVIVALIVAGRSERRMDRDKMEVAKLVAAEMSVRLEQLVKSLATILQLFADPESDPQDKRNNLTYAKQFADGDMLLFRRETLVDLLPLPNETAHRVARAMDLLRLVKANLAEYVFVLEHASPQMVSSIHKRIGRVLAEAHAELRVASDECTKAAQLDAPMIPEVEVQ